MGYAIAAVAMVFVLIVGNVQFREQQRHEALHASFMSGNVAADMLRLANHVNDWRYRHVPAEGELKVADFNVVPSPNPRIRLGIWGGRLWVWTLETPDLAAALTRQSTQSALIGRAANGRLQRLDGSDMPLSLPAGPANGDLVYLN